MDTYKVQRRDMEKKAKRLRREGYVTGNLFGRDIEQSIPLQFEVKEAEALRKSKHTQMTLDLEGKKYNVLLKELHYDAAKHQIVEMDFQELVKGEVIHATAEVVLENKEAVTEGVLEQLISEVAYKAKAEDVYNRHKLLTVFLQKITGLPEDQCEENACRVEHQIDADVVAGIQKWVDENK